jgi:hypothetical protein
MGRATKRGTFEERVALAKERNAYLTSQLPQSKNATVHKIYDRHGIQRLATVLTAAGMIPVPTKQS